MTQLNHREYTMPEVNKFLSKQKTDGWNVLEIGAGEDATFRELFEKQHRMNYTGIDILPITNGKNCYQGLMQALPFPSNRYDLVFACHAFEHTERPVDTLKECLRVLKPGGYLLFITPPHTEHHILKADPDHINVLSEMQLKRLLTYTKYREATIYTSNIAPQQKDHNVITIARK